MRSDNAGNEAKASTGGASDTGSILRQDISEIAFKKCLVGLCLLGLAIRLGFFLEHAPTPSFGVPTLDQKYYDTVARMLLAGEDLHNLHGFRPLLYPVFLALCYKLGGAWGIDLAIFAQHLMGIATGLIVTLLGAKLFRNRLSGVIGGVLYLLAPVPLYFEGELLIEPSYLFLICIGLLMLLQAAEKTGGKAIALWVGSGAVIELASQGRANILVFLAVFPLFAAWRWWHTRNVIALVPLLGVAGALGMAVPWGFANMRQSDHFQLLPNQGGAALYLGNKRKADGMILQQDQRITTGERYEDSIEVWARLQYEAAMRAQGHEPDSNPMAISSYWTDRTVEEIKAAPGAWLNLIAKKCWLTLWNVEVPNNKAFAFLQNEFVSLRLLPVRWVILLVLAPAGLWLAWRRGNRDAWIILAIYAAIYSAANVAFFICDRYRYPVWPAMAVFAGGGVIACIEAVRTRKNGQVIAILTSMILLAALSLHNWFGAILPSYARDYLFRSFACYEKGRFKEALADIDRSIELDPSDVNALHHRGNVLFALGSLEEARITYEHALKLAPEESSTWNNLGATLDGLGRSDEALRAFQRATECNPPSKNAFFGMAVVQIRLNRLADAVATVSRFEKLTRSPDAAMLMVQAAVTRLLGDTVKAAAIEQNARNLDAGLATWALEQINKATKR